MRIRKYVYYSHKAWSFYVWLEANARFAAPFSTRGINSFFSSGLLQPAVSFWCIHVGLVLIILWWHFFHSYIVLGLLETIFVLRGEWRCYMRGYGILTCFALGVNKWWLCEPLGRSYSILKPWNCCYHALYGPPWSSHLLGSTLYSTSQPCFVFSLAPLLAPEKMSVVFLLEEVHVFQKSWILIFFKFK